MTLLENITWVFVALLIAALLVLITPGVMAAPAMVSVAPLTCTTATFNANGGAAGEAWFEWGQHSGGPYYWTTPNQTIAIATFSDYQYGPPMLTGTTYYVRACDTTGCGADLAFIVPAGTRINQTRFGTDVIQIMRSGINLTQTSAMLVHPFTSTISAPVTYGLLFFFIFAGMWVRAKDLFLPTIIGMVAGGAIWAGTGALGIPPEFVDVGQMLLYISIAGFVYSLISR